MKTSNALPTHLRRLTLRFIRALLALYPGSYRRRYQREMARTFGDAARFAYAEYGLVGLISLSAATAIDVIHSAFEAHRHAGLSTQARRRLRRGSAVALLLGVLGSLTPYGTVAGVLVAPLLLAMGVVGLCVTGKGARRLRAIPVDGLGARFAWARAALLAAAVLAGLFLVAAFAVRANLGPAFPGGTFGALSMAASHLAFFGLGWWLYGRQSLWALPTSLTIGAAWLYYRSGDALAIVAGRWADDQVMLVLALGSLAAAVAVCATSLLAAPALLAASSSGVSESRMTDRRRTR